MLFVLNVLASKISIALCSFFAVKIKRDKTEPHTPSTLSDLWVSSPFVEHQSSWDNEITSYYSI